MELLEKLVKEYPNDTELGKKVRELYNQFNEQKVVDKNQLKLDL